MDINFEYDWGTKKPKVGDCVIFKRQVRDRWTRKLKIGGWQGRVIKIVDSRIRYLNEKEFWYLVAYDSISLKQMSDEYIKSCLNKGCDFRLFLAELKHIEPSQPRDTEIDVEAVYLELNSIFNYEKVLADMQKKREEDQNTIIELEVASEEEIFINNVNKHLIKKLDVKEGDSVKILPGVTDWLFEKYDMGGWQGRITEIIREDEDVPGVFSVFLDFDSITLKQMPEEFISDYLDNLRDFRSTEMESEYLVVTSARDTKEDVIATRLILDKKYDYSSILDLDPDEPEILLNMDDINSN